MPFFELIDTLWNVNELATIIPTPLDMGINRYIMECKSNRRYWLSMLLTELIDTLWNVNGIGPGVGQGIAGINRYIMECKFLTIFAVEF